MLCEAAIVIGCHLLVDLDRQYDQPVYEANASYVGRHGG